MNINSDDRRSYYRINFDGKVNLQFNDNSYDCYQIKNLSFTGMFVKGNFQEQQEKNCLIKLFHKETTGNNSLQAYGEMVWKNDEGAGLKFITMSFENYMLLHTTLINKAEHPSIILDELPESSPFEITS